ncbi:hypothetical protein CJ030_MR4G024550 [Morella rubra]|uniref:Reverse transcriptase zinc-binding domain-containing protein n=1 Tax=Morella rubra TaxID=262757 RepID=A0A6A1VVQ4_9ROSI|nr:hypothetical protein CJ030_MR4G024550 [Morella rubra]
MSGLQANPRKNSLFACGIPPHDLHLITELLGYQHGSLPTKYLGVPLISTRLKKGDCQTLVERITTIIRSWTNNFLSYACRFQLIKSVLVAIQAYWAAFFILPQSVVCQVDNLLRTFLWHGNIDSKGGAKIAWQDVCLPSTEGGLDIINLASWNKASMSKHVWNILSSPTDSLWVHWIHCYRIKNHNFWNLRVPGDCPWSWRKILGLRQEIREGFVQVGTILKWKWETCGIFTVRSAYNQLRPTKPEVPWHSLVWFKGRIPRHSFILRLAIQDQLLTQQRLRRMGSSLLRGACYAVMVVRTLTIFILTVYSPSAYGTFWETNVLFSVPLCNGLTSFVGRLLIGVPSPLATLLGNSYLLR